MLSGSKDMRGQSSAAVFPGFALCVQLQRLVQAEHPYMWRGAPGFVLLVSFSYFLSVLTFELLQLLRQPVQVRLVESDVLLDLRTVRFVHDQQHLLQLLLRAAVLLCGR